MGGTYGAGAKFAAQECSGPWRILVLRVSLRCRSLSVWGLRAAAAGRNPQSLEKLKALGAGRSYLS